ncbi:MAG: 2,3,4,5-tetrahydropyridine-2,6-dicarboxylate N-succinyltransferase [Luteitalea sp.]|nr:2,3,4,5-tetrahydropyridine-2,6-dicarboxylate N-succinyltransferase [Luteitalea sp.]
MTVPVEELAERVAAAWEKGPEGDRAEGRNVFEALRGALSVGTVRAAEPDPASPTGWRVNAWVKQGILLGFRFGVLSDMSADHGRFTFFDKDTLPLRRFTLDCCVRVVPGGSAVRDGAFVSRGVVCMPPMFINIGAWVGERALIDSHVLIGTCAQIGQRVHVSAGAQIGGVIEPVGALPVIVEDDALIGGNTGVYEGAVVKERAVIGAGTIITGSTPIYDLPNERIIQPEKGQPLVVPPCAVVVPGARAVTAEIGRKWQLSLSTPVIVKYRDSRTDARTELERWIR